MFPWTEIFSIPAFWYAAAIIGSVIIICATIMALVVALVVLYALHGLLGMGGRMIVDRLKKRYQRPAERTDNQCPHQFTPPPEFSARR